jgi:general secretion pathway protein J
MHRRCFRAAVPPSRLSTGFTLIEVLVAMVIMSILAMMAWQGVDGIVRARDASQSRLDQTLRMNTVLAQWDQDLASIQDTGSVPPLTFDGLSVRLTRRTDKGLQLVVWSLRPGAQPGQAQLLRWTSLPLTGIKDLQDAWVRSQQFVGSEPGQLRTLTGLAQWQIYFYRNNGWSNAQSSGDLAEAPTLSPSPTPPPPGTLSPLPPPTPPGTVVVPLAKSGQLPTGVRVVLTFAEGSGTTGALTRDVALGPVWPPP